MSSDLYEVLSLAARYLFTLLGILIVLRAFAWLLSDRAEKRRRLRSLPDAGMIGELIVLTGSPDLPEGTIIPVPWEGILGSVRSCDLCIPCSGVRKKHLSFSFQSELGLLLHPFSGCDARVNDVLITCKNRDSDSPLTHGSFLQVGSALLRLRLWASPSIPQSETGYLSETSAEYWTRYSSPQSVSEPASPITQDESASALTGTCSHGQRNRSEKWEADWSD